MVLMSNCREIVVWKRLAYFLCFEHRSFLPLRYPKRDGCLRCETLISLASASLRRGKRELSGEAKGLLELRL